jgi:hypothetical protein
MRPRASSAHSGGHGPRDHRGRQRRAGVVGDEITLHGEFAPVQHQQSARTRSAGSIGGFVDDQRVECRGRAGRRLDRARLFHADSRRG